MNLRDKNSKFFFNSVKNHHCHNKILFIHDENDTFITNTNKVNDTIVNYL
jgi:hypothetical protein